MSASRDKFNPASFNVPIIGQPKPEYACAFVFAIDPGTVEASLDQLARTDAKQKGEVLIIYGKQHKFMALADFLETIFGESSEAATGGTEAPKAEPILS